MNAPMSALAKYLLNGYAGEELAQEFKEQASGVLKNKDKFYISKNYSTKTINFTKDINGNNITKKHKYYNLSHVIKDFKTGEKTILKNKDLKNFKNLELYFEEKGPHFCAGYLSSRFGEVVRPTTNKESFFFLENFPYLYHKLTEKKQHKAAQYIWLNYKYSELKNI